jgi:hypothetical protein
MRKRTTKFQQELKEAEKVDLFFFLSFQSQVLTFGHTLKLLYFFLFGQNSISFHSHTKSQKMKRSKTEENREKKGKESFEMSFRGLVKLNLLIN